MDGPDVAGVEIKDHVGRKEGNKRQPRRLKHTAQQGAPQGHEQIKPEENDEKVNMVHGQAVPQGFDERRRLKQGGIMTED